MAAIVFIFSAGCREPSERDARAVATIRPVADVVAPILETEVDVLLSAGASPHTYDPRPSDVRAAATASILFFASDDLDGWATQLDADIRTELLPFVPDSLLLGESNRHPDPHFWMDPLTVRAMLPPLVENLCGVEPSACDGYRSRAEAFGRQLAVVHDSVAAIVHVARGATVLLSHPFLGYFARRYGLRVGGIVEEIPGSEPTPRDVMQMIAEAETAGARAIFTLPQHPSRAARAVAEATGIPIMELDPIGGGQDGYADLLYFNAAKIRQALAQDSPSR